MTDKNVSKVILVYFFNLSTPSVDPLTGRIIWGLGGLGAGTVGGSIYTTLSSRSKMIFDLDESVV